MAWLEDDEEDLGEGEGSLGRDPEEDGDFEGQDDAS